MNVFPIILCAFYGVKEKCPHEDDKIAPYYYECRQNPPILLRMQTKSPHTITNADKIPPYYLECRQNPPILLRMQTKSPHTI